MDEIAVVNRLSGMAIMNNKSIKTLALSVTFAAAAAITTMAAPAFADDTAQPVFPMQASVFQQHVEDHIAKRQARLEQRITDEKLDATKAQELRDRFNARVVSIRAAVATATADGVVTKEEAQTVRQAEGTDRHPPTDAPAQK